MSEQKKSRRQVLEEFVARKPDDAFSRYGLALECLNGGDASAADQHFRALIERNGEYVPAYLMYAQLLVRESRSDTQRRRARTVGDGSVAGGDWLVRRTSALTIVRVVPLDYLVQSGSKTAALQVVWYHRCGTSCGLNAFRCFR